MLWRLNTNLSTSLEKQGGTTLDEYLTFFFIILISSPKWKKTTKAFLNKYYCKTHCLQRLLSGFTILKVHSTMEQLALEAMRQDLAGDNLYFNSAGTQKRRSALNYDNCWLLFFSTEIWIHSVKMWLQIISTSTQLARTEINYFYDWKGLHQWCSGCSLYLCDQRREAFINGFDSSEKNLINKEIISQRDNATMTFPVVKWKHTVFSFPLCTLPAWNFTLIMFEIIFSGVL